MPNLKSDLAAVRAACGGVDVDAVLDERDYMTAAYQRGYAAALAQAVALCDSRANALTDGVVVGDQGFDGRITRASEALCLAAAIRAMRPEPERKDK